MGLPVNAQTSRPPRPAGCVLDPAERAPQAKVGAATWPLVPADGLSGSEGEPAPRSGRTADVADHGGGGRFGGGPFGGGPVPAPGAVRVHWWWWPCPT